MDSSKAIATVNERIPNTIDPKIKMEWLMRVDSRCRTEIMSNYVDKMEDYDYNDLAVPAPYDELYIKYLEAQIHRYLEEINKYNNCMAEYNALFNDFKVHYSRTHKHKGRTRYRFYGG